MIAAGLLRNSCLCLALGVLIGAACGQEIPDERLTTDLDEPGTHSFARTGESLWLDLLVPRAGILSYRATNSEVQARIFVYDDAGKRVSEFRWAWVGKDQYWDRQMPAGRFTIELQCQQTAPGQTLDYSFRLDAMEPSEPDGSFEQATPVEFGLEYPRKFIPRGDRDHFKVPVSDHGIVSWSVENWSQAESGSERPAVEVYDSEGNRVAAMVRSLRVQPGTYTLMFQSARTTPNPVRQLANFRFAFEADPDPLEPNDTLATAKQIALDQDHMLRFYPRVDWDYLSLDVPGDGVLWCELEDWTDPTKSDRVPALNFYDAQGTLLQSERYDMRVSTGTYFALFASNLDARAQRVAKEPFTIRFRFAGERDPTEPANDEMSGARALTLDQPFAFGISPSLDRDWFAFEKPVDGEVQFRCEPEVEGLLLRAQVVTEEMKVAADVSDRSPKLLRRGSYYLVLDASQHPISDTPLLAGVLSSGDDVDLPEPSTFIGAPATPNPTRKRSTLRWSFEVKKSR